MAQSNRRLSSTTYARIEAIRRSFGLSRIGSLSVNFITIEKPVEEIDMGALKDVFEISRDVIRISQDVLDVSATVNSSLEQFRDQTAAYNRLTSTIQTLQTTVERLESMTKQELQELKSALQGNTTTIAEIAGDMANLKHFADTQTAKVDELNAKLKDLNVTDPEVDAIIGDLKALAAAQHNSLGSIASQYAPELPVGPGTPGEVPAPGTPATPAPPTTTTPAPPDNGPTPEPTPEPTPVTPAPTFPPAPPIAPPAPADPTTPGPITPGPSETPVV